MTLADYLQARMTCTGWPPKQAPIGLIRFVFGWVRNLSRQGTFESAT
jgi:hypothetical protein